MQHPQASTCAAQFFDTLHDLGVAVLFCNLGTDHAPLIEELARRRRAAAPLPRIVLCPHENTAMHMAAGYAVATGAARRCWCTSTPVRPTRRWACTTRCALTCRCS